jgi:methylamine---glutamate N-methyltransferase subunit B
LQRHNRGRANAELEFVRPNGVHSVAVALDAPIGVRVRGSTGCYGVGMNAHARFHVKASAGPGVAENMMSGGVEIAGEGSQYAGAAGGWSCAATPARAAAFP